MLLRETAIPVTYGPDPVTGMSYSCNPASPSGLFFDVPATDAFCKHVHFLRATGVIAGCGVTSYCPTRSVKRDEMSKFLSNASSFYSSTGPELTREKPKK